MIGINVKELVRCTVFVKDVLLPARRFGDTTQTGEPGWESRSRRIGEGRTIGRPGGVGARGESDGSGDCDHVGSQMHTAGDQGFTRSST